MKDTNVRSKQYRFTLDVYLMNVLSYSYVIVVDHAINALGYGKMLLMDWEQLTEVISRRKCNLLVNYKVTIPQIFEFSPVLQKLSIFHLQINVKIFSIIKKYWMYLNLAQKCKRYNHYSNINNVLTMLKLTLILFQEVQNEMEQ